MTAAALLEAATAVLHGEQPDRNRIACWLSRTAMESAVDDLLSARGLKPGSANMRSKLTCLEAAYMDEPEVTAKAGYAWSRLSEACHQHAYELSPTYAEAEHLVSIVRALTCTEKPA
jgi:hypothetical protein